MIMINCERKTYSVIPGYNLDCIYKRVNELLDLDLEFEIDQSWGTDCYGIEPFNPNYPSLKELENELINEDGLWWYSTLINYLRRLGELPEEDLIFEISY